MTPAPSSGLRADARRNRELILEAAEELFASEGLSVSVDEIARRAGVGAGTLYRHFPTKEAMFEAVLVAHLDAISARARELATAEDSAEALFEFMTYLADEGTLKKNLADSLARTGVDIHDAAPESKRALEDGFRELLRRAQADGSVRADVTIDDLIGLVMGTCTMANPQVDSLQAARMMSIVCAGLRATS